MIFHYCVIDLYSDHMSSTEIDAVKAIQTFINKTKKKDYHITTPLYYYIPSHKRTGS